MENGKQAKGSPNKIRSDRRETGSVKVRKQEDLVGLDSLYKQMDAMLENRYEVFLHNVEYLCRREGLTQAKLCSDKLEGAVSSPQFTGYKQRGRDIPFRVMVLIATAFGVTVEDMCGQVLDEAMDAGEDGKPNLGRPLEEYEKYLGTFDLAYFDTSAPLGLNAGATESNLARAVLTIYATRNAIGMVQFHATAIFNCTVEERTKIANFTAGVDFKKDAKEVRDFYEKVVKDPSPGQAGARGKCLYDGGIKLTEGITELELHQVYGNDVVHLMTHNRAANSSSGKLYRGGLAAMMSVSRGAEHMPCMQSVILMRGTEVKPVREGTQGRKTASTCRLDYFAPELLAEKIYLAPPKIELDEEIEKISHYMKALFYEGGSGSLSQLSPEDKAFCLKTFAEKNLTDSLRRNILSYYKLALQMDTGVYDMIQQAQNG